MEVIHTILVIYPALWWGCNVIIAGAQKTKSFLQGADVQLWYYFKDSEMRLSNCQWYFSQDGNVETQLTNGTRYTWSCSQRSSDNYWVYIQISFKNATFTDTGKYTCEAITSTGKEREELLLTVHAKPVITVPKTNYTATSGTNVTLECVVNAIGETITFTGWKYKMHQQWYNLSQSDKYFWNIQMPSLFISNIRTEDSRFYRCFVSTTLVTVDGSDIYLKVQDVPFVNVENNQFLIICGNDVVLQCTVDGRGVPIIKVMWYRRAKTSLISLENNTKYSWKQQGVSASIRISKATEEDAGIYVCEGTSEVGSSKGQDIELRVGYFPLVNVQNTQFLIISGNDVVLQCTVDGRGIPIIKVMWYRRAQASLISLENNTKYSWTQQGVSASIRISKATEEDAGIYVCEGTSEVGSSKGQDIELRVGYKPTVTAKEYNYNVGIRGNLTLHCSIDGHGSAVNLVDWLKEKVSGYEKLQQSSNPSLNLINIRWGDAGRYICRGRTEFGYSEIQQISVKVFAEPRFFIPKYQYQGKTHTTVLLEVIIDVEIQTLLSVQWEKYKEDNQQWYPLQNSSRLVWNNTKPSLVIATAFLEDGGRYRVAVRTTYHEVTSSPITLTIYIPVQIQILETRPMVIREGERVEIRCLVDGWPEPRISWRLDNGTMVASSFENGQGSILVLENVTKLTEGNYTCIARNNFSLDESLISLTVSDLPVSSPKDLTGSSSENDVVHVVSVVACVAFIAVIVLIVVFIFIRRKRCKGRKDKPDSGTRSANGQQQSSPSRNTRSGNGHAEVSVIPLENPTYAQVIRKPNTRIDGSRSTTNTDISQYMNINNTYATVQKRPSASNPNSSNCEETESENTQVSRTEELNYVELEFNSDTQDENCKFVIRGSPSNTTYTEVVVFTR